MIPRDSQMQKDKYILDNRLNTKVGVDPFPQLSAHHTYQLRKYSVWYRRILPFTVTRPCKANCTV